jgi:D-alanine-D-alanine ligase
MRIGITFDLKSSGPSRPGVPDDDQEEFDSPVTIKAVAQVLRDLGHEVTELGDGKPLVEALVANPPDFVFNFAEGHGIGRSREARVPALCEMLNIPYSGSDPLTLATTLDKDCARRLAASHGITVARGLLISGEADLARVAGFPADCYPAILKPAWEGSSKGITKRCLVDTPDELKKVARELARDYTQPILVEEFIAGDELTVGIIGNERPDIVGIMRVLPNEPTERFVYSLEVKRDWRRLVRYECPAELTAEDRASVKQASLKIYNVLGCRDVARIDFRLRKGVPYFLELNPLPGINPESSDLVLLAQGMCWSYAQLVGRIFAAACRRNHLSERCTDRESLVG